MLAWHGTKADGTTRHLKMKEIIGVKNVLAGNVEICANALHGSMRAVDMLHYSEGLWIKRTLHEGLIVHDSDKIGSSERTVIAEADATTVVIEWSMWCADRAVRIHAAAALRRAGMNTVGEKLANLEAITDKKSADAASWALTAASNTAANIAYTAHAAGCAAHAAVHSAVCAALYATHAIDAIDSAVCAAASTVRAASNANEMNFLNAELERRLLALMGLTQTEVIQ